MLDCRDATPWFLSSHPPQRRGCLKFSGDNNPRFHGIRVRPCSSRTSFSDLPYERFINLFVRFEEERRKHRGTVAAIVISWHPPLFSPGIARENLQLTKSKLPVESHKFPSNHPICSKQQNRITFALGSQSFSCVSTKEPDNLSSPPRFWSRPDRISITSIPKETNDSGYVSTSR